MTENSGIIGSVEYKSTFKDKEELLLEYDKRRFALQSIHRHGMQDLDRWYWNERHKLEWERRESGGDGICPKCGDTGLVDI